MNATSAHDFGGTSVTFPFREPYPSQLTMMRMCIEAARGSKTALIESPTGTGKTIAIMTSLIALQAQGSFFETTPPKSGSGAGAGKRRLRRPFVIVYATRTHSQVKQIVREIRKIPKQAYAEIPEPRLAVLGSKARMCIFKTALNASSKGTSIDVECRRRGRGAPGTKKGVRRCPHLDKRISASAFWRSHGNLPDMEDIVSGCESSSACPYYQSRSLAEQAAIVVCPYNYLVDPAFHSSLPFQLMRAVVVLDEAHNIDSSLTESATLAVRVRKLEDLREGLGSVECETKSSQQVLMGLQQLAGLLRPPPDPERMRNANPAAGAISGDGLSDALQTCGVNRNVVIDALNEAKTYSSISDGPMNDAAGSTERLLRKLILMFSKDATSFSQLPFFTYLSFSESSGATPTQRARGAPTPGAASQLILNVYCPSPSVAFGPLHRVARSVILASGTLSPIETWAQELQVTIPLSVSLPHVVPSRNLSVRAVRIPRLDFNSRQNPAIAQRILETIKMLRSRVGGTLVFFPSYGMMKTCSYAWHSAGLWPKFAALAPKRKEPKRGLLKGGAKVTSFFKEKVIDAPRTPARRLSKALPAVFTETALHQSVRRFTQDFDIESFSKAVYEHRTPVLLAVCRGKSSEGIDFAEALCRSIIIVGVPFPATKNPHVVLKRQFNNVMVPSLPGSKWYTLQASRAANQAAGRAIRNQSDWGSIWFADERWCVDSGLNGQISTWLRDLGGWSAVTPEDGAKQIKRFEKRMIKRDASQTSSPEPARSPTPDRPPPAVPDPTPATLSLPARPVAGPGPDAAPRPAPSLALALERFQFGKPPVTHDTIAAVSDHKPEPRSEPPPSEEEADAVKFESLARASPAPKTVEERHPAAQFPYDSEAVGSSPSAPSPDAQGDAKGHGADAYAHESRGAAPEAPYSSPERTGGALSMARMPNPFLVERKPHAPSPFATKQEPPPQAYAERPPMSAPAPAPMPERAPDPPRPAQQSSAAVSQPEPFIRNGFGGMFRARPPLPERRAPPPPAPACAQAPKQGIIPYAPQVQQYTQVAPGAAGSVNAMFCSCGRILLKVATRELVYVRSLFLQTAPDQAATVLQILSSAGIIPPQLPGAALLTFDPSNDNRIQGLRATTITTVPGTGDGVPGGAAPSSALYGCMFHAPSGLVYIPLACEQCNVITAVHVVGVVPRAQEAPESFSHTPENLGRILSGHTAMTLLCGVVVPSWFSHAGEH